MAALALPAPLQPVVDRIGGPRRALIVLVGLLVAGLIFGVSQWATRPTWVPAFGQVPVEESGKMTDKLTEAGIEFRLEKAGTEIQVKAEDLARARVTLARDGGLPAKGRPGLELFDQPSWGMTDFTQRINYRRALEGELERTIGEMRGVETAKVHVAMPETQAFRRSDRPLEASVVLQLETGDRPPQEVVQGIAHLVAASVDGLQSERVTIVDDGGRLLTLDPSAASLDGLTARQLALQREVEDYIQKKANDIVGQIVGPKNGRVQVSAEINFDRVERTTEAVDPDKQAIATEQRAEITPGPQGGAGSSNVATSYETTKSTETFSGAIGNVKRLTVAVLVNDKLSTGAKPAPVPRSPAELARIDTLVRAAVGVDTARGDRLSVVNIGFDGMAGEAVEPEPTLLDRAQQFQKPLTTGVTVLALLVVAFMTLRALKPPAPAAEVPALDPAYQLAVQQAMANGEGGALPALASGAEGAEGQLDAEGNPVAVAAVAAGATPGALAAGAPGAQALLPEPVVLPPMVNSVVREQVVATIEQRPEAALKVLRNWLREE